MFSFSSLNPSWYTLPATHTGFQLGLSWGHKTANLSYVHVVWASHDTATGLQENQAGCARLFMTQPEESKNITSAFYKSNKSPKPQRFKGGEVAKNMQSSYLHLPHYMRLQMIDIFTWIHQVNKVMYSFVIFLSFLFHLIHSFIQ